MKTALKIRMLSSLERPLLASGAGGTICCIFDLLHWFHEAYRGPACFGTGLNILALVHEATRSRELAPSVDGRQAMAGREGSNQLGPGDNERIGRDDHCVGTLLVQAS